MLKAKVSVILPCYNVEQYLTQALDSLLKQTLQEIEIIPVDDGSPDRCAKIIAEYAARDRRVRPVYKDNGGYGTAVNAGLDVATGEYVAILEPDDYVMEDYYYILYNEASNYDIDVVGVTGYCEVRNNTNPKLVQAHWVSHDSYLSYDGVNEYFASGNVGITLKIYKRSLIEENSIRLSKNVSSYQDIIFVPQIFLCAKNIRIIKGLGYYYRKDEITSSTKSKHRFLDIIPAVREVLDLIDHNKHRRERSYALKGYALKHLWHYFKRCEKDVSLARVKELILKEIKSITTDAEGLYVHPLLKQELPHYCSMPTRVDTFSPCYFHYASRANFYFSNYFSKTKQLAFFLSELYFYLYLSYQTNRREDSDEIANRLFEIIVSFPKLNALPINHFLERKMQELLFDYSANFNKRLLIVFTIYMKEYVDPSYKSILFESLNDSTVKDSQIQYFPDYTRLFDRDLSSLEETFSKNRFISVMSEKYEKSFLQYIKGKSIAVVGNAPCEYGKGKGDEIDSYDIVIRFNNYSTAEKYRGDYGAKTNIWAVTSGLENLNYNSSFSSHDFVICPCTELKLENTRLEYIYQLLILGVPFFHIDTLPCRYLSNLAVPSVGLYILSYLNEHKDSIDKISIYGFDPVSSNKKKRHYHSEDKIATKSVLFHDWVQEERVLKKLKLDFEQSN